MPVITLNTTHAYTHIDTYVLWKEALLREASIGSPERNTNARDFEPKEFRCPTPDGGSGKYTTSEITRLYSKVSTT